ncbi:MAG: ATP-dependent zinc metalloprotease FtsH [Ruminococcaceae bacterium]|nr:ATP-dependent zinc metalloprotease FtsH [Oscillospiraceae bacterium]
MEKKSPNKFKGLLVYLGIPIIIILVAAWFFSLNPVDKPTYSEMVAYFEEQKVTEFSVNGNSALLTVKLYDGTEVEHELMDWETFKEDVWDDIEKYNDNHPNEPMKIDLQAASDSSMWIELIPTAILVIALVAFWIFIMKRMGGGGMGSKELNFGKAKFKNSADEKKKTTFDDVAGADEEKEELEEIVEFLKSPEKYNTLGARIPKGVLLVGPPGTGKTLLAKAVAGEAGVPFFSISGSDFVEMFVGVGASRVRDLFETAKKNSPCIIFIDEIDAVGRQRGTGLGGGHDEREQTLNQLLVEMDGFGANEGVIMIAATNRADILDPALLRPGRFDRQVMVGYPDINGREAILKVHSREKPLSPDVDLKTIAKSTAGFTGADLANLLNEAALLSARKNKKAITMSEIEEATIKVVVGTEKKSRVMSDHEKKLTAYHEAGHAIAAYACETQDPVHQISIIPRGMAGGYTMQIPTEDKTYRSKKEMLEYIIVCLGGRVAEALIMNDISTGASSDIEHLTQTAQNMVVKYGMSDTLGPINYGSGSNEVFIGRDMGQVKNYSNETAAKIDEEVHSIIADAYKKTENILNANMDKLHEVSAYLMKHEKMSGETFDMIMTNTYVEETPELPPVEETKDNSAEE